MLQHISFAFRLPVPEMRTVQPKHQSEQCRQACTLIPFNCSGSLQQQHCPLTDRCGRMLPLHFGEEFTRFHRTTTISASCFKTEHEHATRERSTRTPQRQKLGMRCLSRFCCSADCAKTLWTCSRTVHRLDTSDLP